VNERFRNLDILSSRRAPGHFSAGKTQKRTLDPSTVEKPPRRRDPACHTGWQAVLWGRPKPTVKAKGQGPWNRALSGWRYREPGPGSSLLLHMGRAGEGGHA
jgi:hypothetical protein